jgi:SNF2 family DNA or RNA helicase
MVASLAKPPCPPISEMILTTELMAHQLAAVERLKGLKVGGLFMEMGTGKTKTAIQLAYDRRHKIDKVVYFCPVNLKQTVFYELQKHIQSPSVYVFSDKTKMGKIPEAWFYVVGVESIGQSDRETLCANSLITDRTLVILDESDTCKNHAALRTRRLTQMASRARYRFIATGTAVGEGVVDLYAQMYFLSPDILGYRSFYSFAANHLEYSEDYKGMIVRSLNTDVIARKIEPYIYQVRKEECLDLPERQYLSRYFSMSWEQQNLYQRAKEEILMSMPDDEIDSYVIFRMFTALREIVSGFWHRTPDPNPNHRWAEQFEPEMLVVDHDRIALLETVLGEIPQTEKVIIWVNFHHCIDQVMESLRSGYDDEAIAQFHGRTSDRDSEIAKWRKDGTRFLVSSPKCGGRGLTLNESAYTVFYNNDFPYRVREQAEARNHRIGQNRKPTYIDIICGTSIDTRIFKALQNKENLVQEFKREMDKARKKGRKALLESL